MEIILEFIIGVLKAFFGEQEPPADMSRRPRNPSRGRPRRGPYNYGDEPRQARTLEEILAEVRREAAQRGGGAPDDTPASPRNFQPPPPPERKSRRLLSDAPDADPATGEITAPAPFAPVDPVDRIDPVDRVAPIASSGAPSAAARQQQQKEAPILRRATQRAAPAQREAPQAIPQQIQQERNVVPRLERLAQLAHVPRELVATEPLPSERSERPQAGNERENEHLRAESGLPPSAAQTRRAARGSAAELARNIRQASQASKLVLARQSVVVMEIFGPPRCLRPIARYHWPQ